MRQKLFSVTLKDCRVDTFRSGGNGGQNQNKVESGVRVTHLASGAVGECRETRSQIDNKRRAFRRMAESQTFKLWVQRQALGLNQWVEEQMRPENIQVEYYDPS